MYCSAGPSIETPAARTHPRIKALAICVDLSLLCVLLLFFLFFIYSLAFCGTKTFFFIIILAVPVESEYNERTGNAVAGCCGARHTSMAGATKALEPARCNKTQQLQPRPICIKPPHENMVQPRERKNCTEAAHRVRICDLLHNTVGWIGWIGWIEKWAN